MKKFGFLLISLLAASVAYGKSNVNLQQDFDTLGDNAQIIERARMMNPDNKVRIVQNRLVDRTGHLELGVNYGLVGGGDSYFDTQNLGANMDFHFSNHFSLGARYAHSYNTFTTEGQNVLNYAQTQMASGGNPGYVPQMDFPTDTGLIVASWYPFYGKLNLFNMGVTHFDIYGLVGYGKTAWVSSWGGGSGLSDTYAAGGGVGFWVSKTFTIRLEARYQTYTDNYYDGSRQENTVVGMGSLGILL